MLGIPQSAVIFALIGLGLWLTGELPWWQALLTAAAAWGLRSLLVLGIVAFCRWVEACPDEGESQKSIAD